MKLSRSLWLCVSFVVATPSPLRAQIVAALETPDVVASQVSNIQGWAYTQAPRAELVQPFEVRINGELVMEIPCCSGRGDVQDAHPDAPLRTGFSGVWNWGLTAKALGLPRTSPVTVSVTISDTVGSTRTLTKDVHLHGLDDEHSFFSNAEWAEPDEPVGSLKRGWCMLANVGELADPGSADLTCLNLVATRPGALRDCDVIRFSWDRASQGFKQTSDCLSGGRWAAVLSGGVIDLWTGLEWQGKTGVAGPTVRCDDEAPVIDPLCDDPSHINNIYNWGGTSGAPDEAPTGSVFTRFLAQLNGATSADGIATTGGCMGSRCDWRLPTIEELRTLHDASLPGCAAPPPPLLVCTDIPGGSTFGFYWSITTDGDDATQALTASAANTGIVAATGKGMATYARAVRGDPWPNPRLP